MNRARLLMAMLSLAPGAAAQVSLRGGDMTSDPVVSVAIEGVQIGGSSPRLLGWDRVRKVEGEHAEAALAFAELSDAAWRARTRLDRGDVALAQPLFEELFETYDGFDGPTAFMVAQGLLQCRLATLAQPAAVAPWLEMLRLHHGGDIVQDDVPPLDAETMLAPELPPIWLESSAVTALAREAEQPHDDQLVQTLARLYIDSAAGRYREPNGAMQKFAGVELVAQIVKSTCDDEEKRASARQWLRAGLSADQGTWREAWRRAALGRSMLMERDIDTRRQGLVHLLHVPARFSHSQRYLTGVALALASEELRSHGDTAAAERLARDLNEHDAAHPALQWLDRRRIERSGATAATSGAHKETT